MNIFVKKLTLMLTTIQKAYKHYIIILVLFFNLLLVQILIFYREYEWQGLLRRYRDASIPLLYVAKPHKNAFTSKYLLETENDVVDSLQAIVAPSLSLSLCCFFFICFAIISFSYNNNMLWFPVSWNWNENTNNSNNKK